MTKFLITILFSLFVVAGCGGSEAEQKNREAADWVVGLGGTLEVSGRSVPIEDAAQLPDGALTIVRVVLNETDVTDDGLQELNRLKNLEYLGLYRAEITDAGIEHIAQIKSLTELELSYTQITDAGLRKLQSLENLKKIFLYGTDVTSEGIDAFREELSDCVVYSD